MIGIYYSLMLWKLQIDNKKERMKEMVRIQPVRSDEWPASLRIHTYTRARRNPYRDLVLSSKNEDNGHCQETECESKGDRVLELLLIFYSGPNYFTSL